MSKILFKNFTTTNKFNTDNAISIINGNIERIGLTSDFSDFYQTVIDLKGHTLLPGFIDTHTHFLHSSLSASNINLYDCKNAVEVNEKLKDSIGKSALIRAYAYDDSDWINPLKKSDLDHMHNSTPIVIFRLDMHGALVNSEALKMLKIPQELNSCEVKEGIFNNKYFLWLSNEIAQQTEDTARLTALKDISQTAFSKGITTVHALEGGFGWGMKDIDFLLSKQNIQTPNIVIYPQTVNLAWIKSRGLKRAGGCLLLDGTIGNHTAALFERYSDKDTNGELYFSDKALFSFVERAHLADMQLSFHAIGDRAVNQIVNIYEKVLKKHPKKEHRHRIEHCELVKEEDIERIAKLNIYLSVQPTFEYLFGGEGSIYEKRLGKERVKRTNIFKKYLQKHISIAGGSDFDVTPLDPLLGIHSAVNNSNEALTISQAIDLFTKNAGYFSFEESKIGSLTPGKRADFAVLSKNPIEVNPVKLKDIKILKTFMAGSQVFPSIRE